MEALRLDDGRAIPDQELQWTFARAAGPGGQSVNTTDSAVRNGRVSRSWPGFVLQWDPSRRGLAAR